MRITRQQMESLKQIYYWHNVSSSYLTFRRTVLPGYECIMVHVSDMYIGIEKDGYRHT